MRLFRLFCATLLVASCSGAPEQENQQALPVEVLTIAPEPVPNMIELPGRVEAFRTAEVRARVTGILQRQLYRDGTDVGQGQVLFRIDPAELQASYAQTQASLQRARATAANARAVVERYRPLVSANAISSQEFDAAVASSREADANVAQIQAELRANSLQLGYTTVRAPIAGRAGRTQVTEGALVTQAEGTLLTTIEQISTVYVVFSQSAREVLEFRRGIEDKSIALPPGKSVPVTLILPDGTIYPISGTIDFLDQSVEQSTGTVELRARFANPEGLLLPGEFVRVQVEAGTIAKGIAVPQGAVTVGESSGSVYVVDGDGKAAIRQVILGQMVDGRWIIEDGLTAGDRVIVNNLQKIRPGMSVAASSARPSGSSGPASPAVKAPAASPATAHRED